MRALPHPRNFFLLDEVRAPPRCAFALGPRRRRLRPPPPGQAAAGEASSVTAFRDWLACPFRFRPAGNASTVSEPVALLDKAELDAAGFGNLVHLALRVPSASPKCRDCLEAKRLEDALLARFEAGGAPSIGDRLALPLMVRFEFRAATLRPSRTRGRRPSQA
jgi:hypothetical protein